MTSSDKVKPIPDCEFCCVPPAKRGEEFLSHPKCAACTILMGPGHVEEVAEYCSSCRGT